MRLISLACIALAATSVCRAQVSPGPVTGDASLQVFVAQTVAAAQEKGHQPAMAALVHVDGKFAAGSVIGVRALGHPERATLADRWHIGSDTKAFTSTMIARLVEQQVMGWDDTLAKSFPDLAKDMDPAYRDVTIRQLLSHTAGLPALTNDADVPLFMQVIGKADGVKAQRAAIARTYLSMPPASKVGEFMYSNLGFIIAGAVAESHTGKSWEELIREQVFTPLGITQAGFGAPGSPGRVDEPWGHREVEGRLVPLDPASPESDNPPALGPAGTINISLWDWMRFAQDQLDGARGRGKLLKPETYRTLQTPVVGYYALGWGAKLGPDGVPLVLTHSGSNEFWYADVRVYPRHDTIVLVVSNAGNEAAEQSVSDVRKALQDRLKPLD